MELRKAYRACKRNGKKILKSKAYRSKFYFTKYYENSFINDTWVYMDSYSGSSFSGNIYYIFEELRKDKRLDSMRVFIGVTENSKRKVESFLRHKGYTDEDYTLVEINTKKYCEVIATSHYLFTNSTLPTYFIKKEGQILLNTWHGTPWKQMGRGIKSAPHEIGNTQRNFLMSDYLLYPNNFMKDIMIKDYMLENIYQGKYLVGGYPRNHVYHDIERQKKIKKELGLEEDMQVFAYMPTWRGTTDSKNIKGQQIAFEYFLYELDRKLTNNQILFVNPHNFVKEKIVFDKYKHIRVYPDEFETYEITSIADCLITDYSSVFFDYGNTGRKIIMFNYDEYEYLHDRGLYIPLDELPFVKVHNVEELWLELNRTEYRPYPEFQKTYCSKDSENNARKIVDLVFYGSNKGLQVIDGKSLHNGKENILIFGGPLMKNGITTSLVGLLDSIDTDMYNYFLIGYRSKIRPNRQVLQDLRGDIDYLIIQGNKIFSIKEAWAQFKFYRMDKIDEKTKTILKRVFQREIERSLPTLKFKTTIHFTGYDRDFMNIIDNMENTKKVVYVHNNMNREKDTRGNFHVPTILNAYRHFDAVAGVRDSIKDELVELLPEFDTTKFSTIHNVNNIKKIISGAEKEIEFERNTVSTHNLKEINEILDSDAHKFITIGRFSEEKGHLRLLDAYKQFREESEKNKNSYLFIIGGHGDKYKETIEKIETENIENVIVIKSIMNPYPILRRCDIFMLSSYYEGLPMVIMEALILKKPVVCTDITGPREFLSQGYGTLVEDSTKGLKDGFIKAYNHDIEASKFDAIEFNKQALDEFYTLLK